MWPGFGIGFSGRSLFRFRSFGGYSSLRDIGDGFLDLGFAGPMRDRAQMPADDLHKSTPIRLQSSRNMAMHHD
jgi:hypothetical protein